jgi:tellurite resistance protein
VDHDISSNDILLVEKPTDADWILKAMVAVAAADGRLDARGGLIQKVYQDQTGRSVDVSGVVLAVQAYSTKRDVLTELSAAAGSMSRETKEEIMRAAYLTLLADTRIAGEERARLKDIAAALQISEIHFDANRKGNRADFRRRAFVAPSVRPKGTFAWGQKLP